MEHTPKKVCQQSTSNCTIDELDEYSLLGIFSYLEPSDLLNIAQVCRLWEQLSYEAWKNVSKMQFFNFTKQQKTTDNVKKIFPYLKYIPHVFLFTEGFPSTTKKEFTKFLNQIFEILSESENNRLKSIEYNVRISRNLVQKLFKANIRNLEEIYIEPYSNRIEIAHISHLIQYADNLKEFHWSIKTETEHSLLLPTLRSLPKTLRVLQIACLYSIEKPIDAESLIKHLNQFPQLDDLGLYKFDFKLIKATPFYTTARELHFNVRMYDTGTVCDYSFLPTDPQLKKLLLESGLLTNENMDFILKNYSSLEWITFIHVDTSEAQIGRLSELGKLKTLRLVSIHHWTGSTLKFFPHLEELHISGCFDLEMQHLFDWLYTAKNLKSLSLREKEIDLNLLKEHLKKSRRIRIHKLVLRVWKLDESYIDLNR
ncbi:hypothetical protein TKK_0003173 [Trichogramma kaykai]|uniref:F-box domain-containing protein n=1 Tax=Trichogramma kaykai TaxID=54128 RepID=A0ABD2WT71_9HYME